MIHGKIIQILSIILCLACTQGAMLDVFAADNLELSNALNAVKATIEQAAKDGVGTKAYQDAVAAIEASAAGGESNESLIKRLNSLSAALNAQAERKRNLKSAKPMPAIPAKVDAKAPAAIPDVSEATSIPPVVFTAYMSDTQRRVRRAWFSPKCDKATKAVCVFNVHANGTVTDLALKDPSGFSIFDSAVMKAITNASPFRPLPLGAKDPTTVEFTFDYNLRDGTSITGQ